MPTVSLTPTPYFQGLDANGNPINGGKLFAYVAGSSTKQDTYTTAAGSSANTNPVILDSSGRASVFLDVTQSYKLVLAPSTDTDPPVSPIWTQDNIAAVPSSVTIIPTGLVVGFSGTVLADAIQLGDATNVYDYNSGNPQWQVDTGDWVRYTRASNSWAWAIAAVDEMQLDASGLQITNGLNVGFSGTPTDDAVAVGDTLFWMNYNSGNPIVRFDTGDFFLYTRATNTLEFKIGSTAEVTWDASGVQIADGLVVGYAATPVASQIRLGDANCLWSNTAGIVTYSFDSTDSLRFTKSTNVMDILVGNAAKMYVTAFGVTGLYGADVASAAAIVPTGNVFTVTGTTTITSITSTGIIAGMRITIIFADALTFTDGSNLVLAGNFTTSANDTITLVYNGTNWYETARSVN